MGLEHATARYQPTIPGSSSTREAPARAAPLLAPQSRTPFADGLGRPDSAGIFRGSTETSELDDRALRLSILPGLAIALTTWCVPAAAQTNVPASRSDGGRLLLSAAPSRVAIHLDGKLDEPIWRSAEAATGFVQAEPLEGRPASERTEVRVAYDRDHLYIGAYLHDDAPDKLVVNDIKKDFDDTGQDAFAVILDTFLDHRNGYVFITNPEGARADWQVSNEGKEINRSWDAIWSVRTRRVADGWTVEMSIPFRSLRFTRGARQEWGINFSRRIRRKNELVYWSPIPRSYALTRLSLAGVLDGLPDVEGGRDLRAKPYVLGGEAREAGTTGYQRRTEVGMDVKAQVLGGFTLDVTANPDFAQVEADVQQVNLTQFSQFFPEKREFFLENSGLFYVGDAARGNQVTPRAVPDEDLLLFFSRRIGVAEDGRAVPIQAGARLTGRARGTSIGAIAMRTDALEGIPADDYTVLRVRQNVAAGSDVGGIFMMRRARGTGGSDYNRVWGADTNIRFFGNLDWSSYAVRSEAPGMGSGQYAWRSSLNRETDFTHAKVGVMELGKGFSDDLGFFRRTGVRKYFWDLGARFRSEGLLRHHIREIHPHFVWNYFQGVDGGLVAKMLHSGLTFFFPDGGYVEFSGTPNFERIDAPFEIASTIDPIPAGSYGWTEWRINGTTDPSRKVSVGFKGIVGGLWSGTQRTVDVNMTVRPSFRFWADLRLQRTAGDLEEPSATFTKTFWTLRGNYSFNTNMFVDALVQYDPVSEQMNTNIRFNLIHHPLSDLFIVYNEQRFWTGEQIPAGRGLTIKVTQTVAF